MFTDPNWIGNMGFLSNDDPDEEGEEESTIDDWLDDDDPDDWDEDDDEEDWEEEY